MLRILCVLQGHHFFKTLFSLEVCHLVYFLCIFQCAQGNYFRLFVLISMLLLMEWRPFNVYRNIASKFHRITSLNSFGFFTCFMVLDIRREVSKQFLLKQSSLWIHESATSREKSGFSFSSV